jgi:hypothetical protein
MFAFGNLVFSQLVAASICFQTFWCFFISFPAVLWRLFWSHRLFASEDLETVFTGLGIEEPTAANEKCI